jgi:glycerol uptake facilitator-like aquaporin
MAERLANGNSAVALLANTAATGGALVALIITFGSLSGAHFNPIVTFAFAWRGNLPWSETPFYLLAQFVGAGGGVMAANTMFGLPVVFLSQHARAGLPQMFSEFIATFGLLAVILGASRLHVGAIALAVGAYISGAYWFTASTSFANPAVTLARALSDTFAGIRPADVPGFVVAQCAAAVVASLLFRWLVPRENEDS